MPVTAVQPRILFLAKPGASGDSLLSQLTGHARIEVVHNIEDAIEAMQRETFDFVLSDQRDFLPVEQAVWNQQASTILETIGQGVCIVDLDGHVNWANPKMRSFPDDLMTQVSAECTRTFGDLKEHERGKPAYHRARRLSLTAGDDQHFEVTITPLLNELEEIQQITAVVWDVTHSRRLQKKVDAIDLAGRELVQLGKETARMSVEERIKLLEDRLLRYMHDLLHYDNFAVLLIDQRTDRLDFVLQHGMSPRSRELDIFASPENNGISGYVAATGRSYICHDTATDARYLQGLETARSSLTVPLRLRDKVIGVFDVESEKVAAFNEDDRQFAEMLARYIALALHMLDLLIIERYETSGRLADDVSGEIAGPLNDIITDASTLMEEYIGNDDLRHRLGAICDSVGEIKSRIKEVASPQTGILGGLHSEKAKQDPVLTGRRILVADDEEVIRETIANLLCKAGCDVETAADGAEAVERIEQTNFDMILADIKMPHKNGYDVFAAAKDRDPDVHVLLMTGFGYDPNHSIVRARKEGLTAVLFKPFKVDQLLTEIRTALQS